MDLKINWPLASSSWDQLEIDAMHSVIDSGNFSMGNFTDLFEKAFARWSGSRYAVMVNSGSSANLLATAALAYARNPNSSEHYRGEVIVPAVSWSTTYFPLHQLGYKLVFIDVDQESFNIDVSLLRKALSPDTVGICGVNLLGEVAEWNAISKFAVEHELWTLEDNCESMGAEKDGTLSGRFGNVGTFSFFYSHHICTMEGGMAITDSEELYLYMLSLRAHGWARNIPNNSDFFSNDRSNEWQERFRFYLPGYNLRPLELSSAIGLEQLKKFPKLLEMRRQNAEKLSQLMQYQGSSWRLQKTSPGSSHFTFGLVNSNPRTGKASRDTLVGLLESEGIQTRPIVAGNFLTNPVMRYLPHRVVGNLENAQFIHDNGLMIGNHHFDLSDKFPQLIDLLVDSEQQS